MRNHVALTAFVCLFAAPALAQTSTATGTGVGVSESNSGAVAIAKGGNNLTINNPANTTSTATVNSRVSGTQTIKSAPSMVAPGLTAAGLETCLGSASGGVSAVGFGITGGSTYKDEDCTARLDSRTLFAMGLKAAAVARLCQRPDVWRSMPEICQQYWPVGVPLPAGIVIAGPRANITLSADSGGAMRVVDGRDGVEKDCLNYSASRQKCFHWAGEQPAIPRKRIAAVTPSKTLAKPKPEARRPAEAPVPAVTTPSEAPKATEPEKKT
jgi:hypothetical protein